MKKFYKELGDLSNPHSPVSEICIDGQDVAQLTKCLDDMILIREAEVAIADMSVAKMMGTPCHLAIGQEGVAAGVCSQLTADDLLFGTHRSHSQFLAMGCPVNELMAEILGKVTGCSKGMGGSMHLTGVEHGFGGSVPIVGGTISIAVGAGLAAKLDGKGNVGVCFFGDGSTEEGTFHESLNLAVLYDLPVLFVCENNFYSSHMDVEERQPSDRMARFAEAHKINTRVVDGNDVPAVIKATQELLEKTRNGEGPGFLEAVTYRWRGHVGPDENIDVGVRRSQEDIDAWKKRDPIARLKNALIKASHLSQDDFQKMEANVDSKIKAAIEAAQKALQPSEKLLHDIVYVENN
ncbi:MAG: thiamine pyrophosphate-dependent dehydrogenase E1 component subunit alpha [Sphingomonadales bacterium]